MYIVKRNGRFGFLFAIFGNVDCWFFKMDIQLEKKLHILRDASTAKSWQFTINKRLTNSPSKLKVHKKKLGRNCDKIQRGNLWDDIPDKCLDV